MANERTTEDDFADPWDRLSSELRACKESQRRTWGDLDDATLGRYLAGELSGDERGRVESELGERPELRQLTDLVRDVLGEFSPTPRVLPFPKPKRRPVYEFARRRGALLAAACLLLALGVALPKPAAPSSHESDHVAAFEPGMASRGVVVMNQPEAASEVRVLAAKAAPKRERAETTLAMRAAKLTAERAVALLHEGNDDLNKRGDLAGAQDKLTQSYAFCKTHLSDDHPTMRSTACSLADYYAVVLNVTQVQSASQPFSLSITSDALPGTDSARRTLDFKLPPGVTKAAAAGHQKHLTQQPVRHFNQNVVPVLTLALKSAPDPEKRRAYARAIGRLGSAARDAVPALSKRLDESSDAAEFTALLTALDQMGEAAQPALASLQRLAKPGPHLPGVTAEHRKTASRIVRQLLKAEGRVGVRDEQGCFTLDVLSHSCKQVAQLAQQSSVAVYVETCPVHLCDPRKRLESMGTHAIYVVIDAKRSAVRVEISESLKRKGFDPAAVRQSVLAGCRNGKFDEALRDGLQVIEDRAVLLKD